MTLELLNFDVDGLIELSKCHLKKCRAISAHGEKKLLQYICHGKGFLFTTRTTLLPSLVALKPIRLTYN